MKRLGDYNIYVGVKEEYELAVNKGMKVEGFMN
jgi:hypothetical protein